MCMRLLAALLALFFWLPSALAIRPLVTDDADVVGDKKGQIETWLDASKRDLVHEVLLAIGPTAWLELTLGFQHGLSFDSPKTSYSLSGPSLQAKFLVLPFVDNGHPGVALAVGGYPSLGLGELTPKHWGIALYAALTQSFLDEDILIHANVGLASTRPFGDHMEAIWTAGLGVQVRLYEGLHGVGEVYRGDPYEIDSDHLAGQLGLRYFFSEDIQIDGTVILSEHETRGTLGLRMVSPEWW